MAKPAAQTYVLNMNATPSRFQHPVDAPDPVAARYYSRFLVGENPAPTREQATHLAASLSLGDPLADAWIEASQRMDRSAAHAMLAQATAHGVASVNDAPPELRALFAQLESVPLWVDARYLETGCRAFRRTGPLMGLVLSGFSLMGGYRSSAVVKTLMMTGKLKQTAGKRLVDTGRFVLAVTEPGGVAIGKPGYESAIHVRLLHAMIRNKLRSSPDWRTEEWGLPINQADMLGTNLLFSLGYLIGCRELGMKFSAEEAQGVVHLWRYVGYLLGIDESLIPATEREAARAMYMVGASQPPADADSISLAQALHEVPMQRATSEREKRLAQIEMGFRAGVSRMLLGNDVANDLKLPNHPLQHGAKLLLPIVSGIDSLRRLTPFGDEIAYRAGDAWIRYGVKKLDEWDAAQHQAAKH